MTGFGLEKKNNNNSLQSLTTGEKKGNSFPLLPKRKKICFSHLNVSPFSFYFKFSRRRNFLTLVAGSEGRGKRETNPVSFLPLCRSVVVRSRWPVASAFGEMVDGGWGTRMEEEEEEDVEILRQAIMIPSPTENLSRLLYRRKC